MTQVTLGEALCLAGHQSLNVALGAAAQTPLPARVSKHPKGTSQGHPGKEPEPQRAGIREETAAAPGQPSVLTSDTRRHSEPCCHTQVGLCLHQLHRTQGITTEHV